MRISDSPDIFCPDQETSAAAQARNGPLTSSINEHPDAEHPYSGSFHPTADALATKYIGKDKRVLVPADKSPSSAPAQQELIHVDNAIKISEAQLVAEVNQLRAQNYESLLHGSDGEFDKLFFAATEAFQTDVPPDALKAIQPKGLIYEYCRNRPEIFPRLNDFFGMMRSMSAPVRKRALLALFTLPKNDLWCTAGMIERIDFFKTTACAGNLLLDEAFTEALQKYHSQSSSGRGRRLGVHSVSNSTNTILRNADGASAIWERGQLKKEVEQRLETFLKNDFQRMLCDLISTVARGGKDISKTFDAIQRFQEDNLAVLSKFFPPRPTDRDESKVEDYPHGLLHQHADYFELEDDGSTSVKHWNIARDVLERILPALTEESKILILKKNPALLRSVTPLFFPESEVRSAQSQEQRIAIFDQELAQKLLPRIIQSGKSIADLVREGAVSLHSLFSRTQGAGALIDQLLDREPDSADLQCIYQHCINTKQLHWIGTLIPFEDLASEAIENVAPLERIEAACIRVLINIEKADTRIKVAKEVFSAFGTQLSALPQLEQLRAFPTLDKILLQQQFNEAERAEMLASFMSTVFQKADSKPASAQLKNAVRDAVMKHTNVVGRIKLLKTQLAALGDMACILFPDSAMQFARSVEERASVFEEELYDEILPRLIRNHTPIANLIEAASIGVERAFALGSNGKSLVDLLSAQGAIVSDLNALYRQCIKAGRLELLRTRLPSDIVQINAAQPAKEQMVAIREMKQRVAEGIEHFHDASSKRAIAKFLIDELCQQYENAQPDNRPLVLGQLDELLNYQNRPDVFAQALTTMLRTVRGAGDGAAVNEGDAWASRKAHTEIVKLVARYTDGIERSKLGQHAMPVLLELIAVIGNMHASSIAGKDALAPSQTPQLHAYKVIKRRMEEAVKSPDAALKIIGALWSGDTLDRLSSTLRALEPKHWKKIATSLLATGGYYAVSHVVADAAMAAAAGSAEKVAAMKAGAAKLSELHAAVQATQDYSMGTSAEVKAFLAKLDPNSDLFKYIDKTLSDGHWSSGVEQLIATSEYRPPEEIYGAAHSSSMQLLGAPKPTAYMSDLLNNLKNGDLSALSAESKANLLSLNAKLQDLINGRVVERDFAKFTAAVDAVARAPGSDAAAVLANKNAVFRYDAGPGNVSLESPSDQLKAIIAADRDAVHTVVDIVNHHGTDDPVAIINPEAMQARVTGLRTAELAGKITGQTAMPAMDTQFVLSKAGLKVPEALKKGFKATRAELKTWGPVGALRITTALLTALRDNPLSSIRTAAVELTVDTLKSIRTTTPPDRLTETLPLLAEAWGNILSQLGERGLKRKLQAHVFNAAFKELDPLNYPEAIAETVKQARLAAVTRASPETLRGVLSALYGSLFTLENRKAKFKPEHSASYVWLARHVLTSPGTRNEFSDEERDAIAKNLERIGGVSLRRFVPTQAGKLIHLEAKEKALKLRNTLVPSAVASFRPWKGWSVRQASVEKHRAETLARLAGKRDRIVEAARPLTQADVPQPVRTAAERLLKKWDRVPASSGIELQRLDSAATPV
ncbi:hypothetical protein E4K72_21890 [Oxalobacteraceae bacterium OM1]|nr:hypothetical protein E4K72_21890 [Oxalobacteraceae bacterium OM1]